ncbi:MAG: serine O-acetyltransferase [Bacteroidota bacterium]
MKQCLINKGFQNSCFPQYSKHRIMEQAFLEKLFQEHQQRKAMPSPKAVCAFLDGVLKILFPELADRKYESFRELELHYAQTKLQLFYILDALKFQLEKSPKYLENQFFQQLPAIREQLLTDAAAISKGDPAAKDRQEVIRTYPGFFAIAVYRLAHEFFKLHVPYMPRVLTEYAHSKTGVDIHPSAKIGSGFCIDHATGIVIGATAEIGQNVKIYQGVTLGALSVKKELAKVKRHPTIEDHVVIYSGATILGGDTVIGEGSIIGGNVWLVKSVPAYSRVYYMGHLQQEASVLSKQ